MHNKHLAIILAILSTACGLSLILYYRSPPPSPTIEDPQQKIEPIVTSHNSETTIPKNESIIRGDHTKNTALVKELHEQNSAAESTTTQTTQEQNVADNETLPVKMMAGEKNYETKVAPGSNIYILMQKLAVTQGLQFSIKDYPSLGKFVEEINGIKENKQKGIYWLLYINGQSADRGISSYIIQPNDLISWKYDHAQF